MYVAAYSYKVGLGREMLKLYAGCIVAVTDITVFRNAPQKRHRPMPLNLPIAKVWRVQLSQGNSAGVGASFLLNAPPTSPVKAFMEI